MTTAEVDDVYELSPLQQGMLLHSLYGGDGDTYVAQRSFDIRGRLDGDALEVAWQQAVAAHTALRTSFHWEGLDSPLQVVHGSVATRLLRHDWSGLDEGARRARFDELLAADRDRGFELQRPGLQRLHLIRLDDDWHEFVWTHHMLLLDGWSVPIVANDVMQRYHSLTVGGRPPAAAPPYRNYIAWLQRQDLDAARAFWSEHLNGLADRAQLGPLRPAPAGVSAGSVGEHVVGLPADLVAALRAAARGWQVTFNTVVLAAWAIVMQRYTGRSDVTFGCTSSGRPPAIPAVDRMVGSFINTLPLRLSVPPDEDLASWLRRVQQQTTAVRRYEYSPLAQIKAWVGAPGPQPLFDSVVVVDNYPFLVSLGELTQRLSFRALNAFEKTSEPLTLMVTPEPENAARLVFHEERIDADVVAAMMDDLVDALERMRTASRVGHLLDAGRRQPRPGLGGADDYPDAGETLPGLVERQARRSPGAVAVAHDGAALTYDELLRRANAVAAGLVAAGVAPGDVVGVCAERSFELVTGVLGAMLAGAAYLPLEPSLPSARLAFIASDAGVAVALAQRHLRRTATDCGVRRVVVLEDLQASPAHGSRVPVTGADAAYVMYTSGSTGRPKGVVVTHKAIVNRLLWMQRVFPLGPGNQVLQKTPFGFDVSVWELLWPLLTGATTVLARPGGHQDSAYLADVIREQSIDTVHFVPSMLQLFLDEPGARELPALRRVMCSGEALSRQLADRFAATFPDVELHNLYGPTEAAVDVTWWDCARPAPPGVLPIGYPVANTQAHVLDDRLRETPVDVPGELFLGGVQLARGYLNRPALTASSFVAHPLAGPGGRLYRTGDIVRRLPDGSLVFVGRADQQVKVRGYRIEMGEIEHALLRHPSVRDAVVVVRTGQAGPRVDAFVTGPRDDELASIRERVARELPHYMVPATTTILPALPLTHNGKVDRAALPDPARQAPGSTVDTTPANSVEAAIAAAYAEILDVPAVDVEASFFDLGGDSFAAVRAVRLIAGATVAMLTAHPSVRALAAALDSERAADDILVRLTPAGGRPPAHTLVCVPFGGGSVVGYQPLARALPPGIALRAVALPGHELGGDGDLRSFEDIAEQYVTAVLETTDGPLSVYGHCVGVALAVELVRRLEQAGRPVERLFVAASFPFYDRRVLGVPLGRQRGGPAADRRMLRYLQALGGFTGVVDDAELAFVMRAFRHDVAEARRYFSREWPRRAATPRLTTPITFIAGTDDPDTPGYERNYRAWERFSASVGLATVPGGHYFLQHQPQALSEVLERSLAATDREPARPAPVFADSPA